MDQIIRDQSVPVKFCFVNPQFGLWKPCPETKWVNTVTFVSLWTQTHWKRFREVKKRKVMSECNQSLTNTVLQQVKRLQSGPYSGITMVFYSLAARHLAPWSINTECLSAKILRESSESGKIREFSQGNWGFFLWETAQDVYWDSHADDPAHELAQVSSRKP